MIEPKVAHSYAAKMTGFYDSFNNVDTFPLDEVMLANVLSYLEWKSLVNCRSVSRKWKETVTMTNVAELFVGELAIATNLSGMLAKSFPRLKRLEYDFRSPKNSQRFTISDDFVSDGVAQFQELT